MSVGARTTVMVVAITAFAATFAAALIWLIGVAPFHGAGAVATELSIAAVVPLWAYAVRTVVLAAMRGANRATSLR